MRLPLAEDAVTPRVARDARGARAACGLVCAQGRARVSFTPKEGGEYRVGAEVKDASGQPVGRKFTKAFRTTAEDRARPLPEKWTLSRPAVGTRQPLVVEFHEPLDRALLDRFLTVQDGIGRKVAGRIEVGKEERSWSYHTAAAWEDDGYLLMVDKDLEDLAGNTPVRLFDVDLGEAAPPAPTLTLRFRPRS